MRAGVTVECAWMPDVAGAGAGRSGKMESGAGLPGCRRFAADAPWGVRERGGGRDDAEDGRAKGTAAVLPPFPLRRGFRGLPCLAAGHGQLRVRVAPCKADIGIGAVEARRGGPIHPGAVGAVAGLDLQEEMAGGHDVDGGAGAAELHRGIAGDGPFLLARPVVRPAGGRDRRTCGAGARLPVEAAAERDDALGLVRGGREEQEEGTKDGYGCCACGVPGSSVSWGDWRCARRR
jgi:hypothetical protein